MLGDFTGEEKTDCGLNFAGRDGALFVVGSESGGLAGDAPEAVVHERVHDRHRLRRDCQIWVHLLGWVFIAAFG